MRGRFVTSGATDCALCGNGRHSANETGAEECVSCVAGSQTEAGGDFVAAGGVECALCAQGLFSGTAGGGTACAVCAPGSQTEDDANSVRV